MALNFTMSDVEVANRDKWLKAHNDSKHRGKSPYAGAAGGALSYEFTPTGLGTCVTVRCMCGATENVTDWDNFG